MDSFSNAQVVAFRLNRHHLVRRAPLQLLKTVVSDICGIQAQLMSASELALLARVKDLTREDITCALQRERSLAKTWCMRGALHLLAADDLPIYTGGLLRQGLRREREWLARYGISHSEMDAMVRAIVEGLADEVLTRKELAQHVSARLGEKAKRWVEHSWGGIVKQACLQGLVVFGPSRGQEITFVRRDKWLPQMENLPAEKAENMLLRRYLHGYGPAGLADFAAWSGMTVSEAIRISERIDDDIVEVKMADKTGVLLRDDLRLLQKAMFNEESVRLLPSFDCFMLGHKDKSLLVDNAYYKRIYRKAGWLSPVVLLNGRAEGVWTYKKKGKHLHIAIETFYKIPENVRKLIKEETENLAHFYNTACKITFTK